MRKLLCVIFLLAGVFVACADTFVVSVGIATYAGKNVPNLEKTENDAKAFSEFYTRGSANVVTIIGKNATKEQILKKLREQSGKAKKDDKVIFFFSGHGYPGGFCTYEFTNPVNGLAYSDVIDVMKQSKAQTKIIFADACFSGAIRQGNASSKPVSTPNPQQVMLFLSSRGNESSIESKIAANGYFTKYLLRGLRGAADSNKDRSVTAKELFNFVSSSVIDRTKGKQHPVMWGKFPDNMVIVKYNKKR